MSEPAVADQIVDARPDATQPSADQTSIVKPQVPDAEITAFDAAEEPGTVAVVQDSVQAETMPEPDQQPIVEQTPQVDTSAVIETVSEQSERLEPTEPIIISAEEGLNVSELVQVEPVEAQRELLSAEEHSSVSEEIVHATKIVEHMVENHELTESEQEQTEALVTILPESVQESLTERIEAAEPKQVEKIEGLVIDIAQAADTLSMLSKTESVDVVEIEKVEAIIVEMYEELLTELGIELEEVQKQEILTQIKSGDFVFAMQGVQNRKLKITPEIKHAVFSVSGVKDIAHELVGKFVVRQSAQLA